MLHDVKKLFDCTQPQHTNELRAIFVLSTFSKQRCKRAEQTEAFCLDGILLFVWWGQRQQFGVRFTADYGARDTHTGTLPTSIGAIREDHSDISNTSLVVSDKSPTTIWRLRCVSRAPPSRQGINPPFWEWGNRCFLVLCARFFLFEFRAASRFAGLKLRSFCFLTYIAVAIFSLFFCWIRGNMIFVVSSSHRACVFASLTHSPFSLLPMVSSYISCSCARSLHTRNILLYAYILNLKNKVNFRQVGVLLILLASFSDKNRSLK